MKVSVGMVRSRGTQRFWKPRWYGDGFDFGINVIPRKWGFYCWMEWERHGGMPTPVGSRRREA